MISSKKNDLSQLPYLGQGHIELQDALCPSGAFKTSNFFSLGAKITKKQTPLTCFASLLYNFLDQVAIDAKSVLTFEIHSLVF